MSLAAMAGADAFSIPPGRGSMIDRDQLARLEEWGGQKLLRQMIRLFLENAPKRMEAVRGGLEAGDLEAAERGAHSLKSSSANVGGMELRTAAAEMEARASEGDVSACLALLPGLEETYAVTTRALEDLEREFPE